MDYIIFTERNQHEGGIWKFFFPYENNKLDIILSKIIENIDEYSVDVEYGLDTKTLETIEEYSDDGYIRSINVFYRPLDDKKIFNLYKSHVNEEEEKKEIKKGILDFVNQQLENKIPPEEMKYKDYETKLDEYIDNEYEVMLEDADCSVEYNHHIFELFYKGGIISFQKKVSN